MQIVIIHVCSLYNPGFWLDLRRGSYNISKVTFDGD